MSNLLERLKTLVPSVPTDRDRDEAYLAEALDVGDLERRIREMEQRGHHADSDVPFGFGLW
jgi:hypothetical protein